MSKLTNYREESLLLAKRLSKCLIKRETNAIVNGDNVLADTLAVEIQEIVDNILAIQDALPCAIEDPDMMKEVIYQFISNKGGLR